MNESTRHLEWEGCYNVRDLGGLPLAEGGETRSGALVRADVLAGLTARGRRQLLAYGIGTILDLRSPEELQKLPPLSFGAENGAPRTINVPLINESEEAAAKLDAAQSWAELYTIILDYNAERHAQALRAIAAAPPGALLFHCHSGKDRTGLLAALLLSLAGVPDEPIAADYAASRERLWPKWQQMVAEAGGEQNIDRWYRPETEPQTILDVLAHLRHRYGGTEAYLRAGGLTGAEIARLKKKLR